MEFEVLIGSYMGADVEHVMLCHKPLSSWPLRLTLIDSEVFQIFVHLGGALDLIAQIGI
jgi:hypothetical protein